MFENRFEMLVCIVVVVKFGVIVGMFNYNQCDEVLEYSIGLIKFKVIVIGEECVGVFEFIFYVLFNIKDVFYFWVGENDNDCFVGFVSLQIELECLLVVNLFIMVVVCSKQFCFYIFIFGIIGMLKVFVMSYFCWLKGGVGMGLLIV